MKEPTNGEIDGQIKHPVLEHPHHHTECPEIPFDLFRHVWFLDLDCYPLAAFELGAVNLGNAGTCDRFFFKYIKDAIGSCGRATKFRSEYRQNVCIGYLRCVIKQAGEFVLYWAWQEG